MGCHDPIGPGGPPPVAPVHWLNRCEPYNAQPQQHANNNHIPGGRFERPQYHGTLDKFGPLKFLEKLKAFMSINRIDWIEMLRNQIAHMFYGDAKPWIINLLTCYPLMSQPEFEHVFKSQFYAFEYEQQAMNEIRYRFQEDDESSCAFVRRMISVYQTFRPHTPQYEQISTIINHLKNNFADLFRNKQVHTTFDLMRVAEEVDNSMKARGIAKRTDYSKISLLGDFCPPRIQCDSHDRDRKSRLQTDPRYYNQEALKNANDFEVPKFIYTLDKSKSAHSSNSNSQRQSSTHSKPNSGSNSYNRSNQNQNRSSNNDRFDKSRSSNPSYSNRNSNQHGFSSNQSQNGRQSSYGSNQPYMIRRTYHNVSDNRFSHFNSDRNFGNKNPSANYNSSGNSGKPQTNQNGQKKDVSKNPNDKSNKPGSDKPKYGNKGSFSKNNNYNGQNKAAYVVEEIMFPADNVDEFFNGDANSQNGSPNGSNVSNDAHLADNDLADDNSAQGSPSQLSETHSEN